MSKIEITSNGTGAGTKVLLDGHEVENLRSISFHAEAADITTVRMVFNSIDVEVNGDTGRMHTLLDGKLYELKPI
jgi:hypothetical protein